MSRLRTLVETIAKRNCTVLVQGESGTGKELVARQVHALSPRRHRPFVPVDCTTLRDTLLESQLFGHVKGAFTGADKATLGFIRAADGGTLFLDEIGELSPQVQAKLLRVIQERVVIPLGSTEAVPVNVRIVAATHRDLKKMVQDGEFREDLFYRLNVVCIEVPPLRERVEDIGRLAEHFLAELSRLYQEPAKKFAPDAVDAMTSYDWPGNVRELANAVEHSYILSATEVIACNDLPEIVRTAASEAKLPSDASVPTLQSAERNLLMRALRASKGNQAVAARMLNIERHRFYRMVARHGLATLTKV